MAGMPASASVLTGSRMPAAAISPSTPSILTRMGGSTIRLAGLRICGAGCCVLPARRRSGSRKTRCGCCVIAGFCHGSGAVGLMRRRWLPLPGAPMPRPPCQASVLPPSAANCSACRGPALASEFCTALASIRVPSGCPSTRRGWTGLMVTRWQKIRRRCHGPIHRRRGWCVLPL